MKLALSLWGTNFSNCKAAVSLRGMSPQPTMPFQRTPFPPKLLLWSSGMLSSTLKYGNNNYRTARPCTYSPVQCIEPWNTVNYQGMHMNRDSRMETVYFFYTIDLFIRGVPTTQKFHVIIWKYESTNHSFPISNCLYSWSSACYAQGQIFHCKPRHQGCSYAQK